MSTKTLKLSFCNSQILSYVNIQQDESMNKHRRTNVFYILFSFSKLFEHHVTVHVQEESCAPHSEDWKGWFMGNKEGRHCGLRWVPVWPSLWSQTPLYAGLEWSTFTVSSHVTVIQFLSCRLHVLRSQLNTSRCPHIRPPAALCQKKPPLYCVEILPWMNSCLPTWLLFFEDQILDLSGTERGEKWLTRLLAAWQIIKLSAWFFFFFKLCLLLHSLKHVPVPLMFIQ